MDKTQEHPSYQRLLQAAQELRGLTVVSHIAKRLGVTVQTMNHWRETGVPPKHHVAIDKKIGVLPRWIADGEGPMTPTLRDLSLTPDQRQLLDISTKLPEEARAALINMGMLLTNLPKVCATTYKGPERRYQNTGCVHDRRASEHAPQEDKVKYA